MLTKQESSDNLARNIYFPDTYNLHCKHTRVSYVMLTEQEIRTKYKSTEKNKIIQDSVKNESDNYQHNILSRSYKLSKRLPSNIGLFFFCVSCVLLSASIAMESMFTNTNSKESTMKADNNTQLVQ